MGLHDPDNHVGEEWLSDHDPEHDAEDAQREIPWGTAENIAHLVDRSLDPHRTHGVRAYPIVTANTRPCRWCEDMYPPNTSWQKFCSPRCRWAAGKAIQRMSAHSYDE